MSFTGKDGAEKTKTKTHCAPSGAGSLVNQQLTELSCQSSCASLFSLVFECTLICIKIVNYVNN